MKANPSAEDVPAPVYVVSLRKEGDKATIANHPIGIGYHVRGYASALPVVSESWFLLRFERNGVAAVGMFQTSPVVAVIHDSAAQTLIIHTANSVYRGEYTIDTTGQLVLDTSTSSPLG